MRRISRRRIGWFLVVALLVTCVGYAPVLGAEGGLEAPLVLALYYGWYDWQTWSQPTCDQPLRLYVSADASVVERHVREAHDAGLDALVQVWYGPSMANNPTAPTLDILLTKAANHDMRVAVLLDMTGPFLRTPSDVATALMEVRDQLARRRAYLSVDARPVVFFLGQQLFPLTVWESLRSGLDPGGTMLWIAEGLSTDALAVFDGLYLHQPDALSGSGSLLPAHAAAVRQWSGARQTSRIWVATVTPGFDDSLRAAPGEAWVRSRAGGATYRDNWALADASDADWILIRSYNEWLACTQIEPSLRDGDRTLTLTAELAAQSRARPEETPQPTEIVEPPTPTPSEPTEPVTATETVTITATATPEITPTATLTPTETPLPTMTPFRLATPTPVSVVSVPEAPGVVPAPQATATGIAGTASQRGPTPTALPRLPVEGGAPSRCLLLPFTFLAAIWSGTRLQKRR
jgi:hypothetical protein